MKARSPRRGGFGVWGIGAVACVACCAGPILAVLGGLSVAGVLSSLFIGVGGLAIALVAAVGFIAVRRGRRPHSTTDAGPVPVELSKRPI